MSLSEQSLSRSSGSARRGLLESIAMALANELLLILADDLIGNLDPKTGEEIMRLFVKPPKEGRTILMLSHDTNIAACSQRTIRFLAGRPTFSLTLPLSGRKGPLTAFGPEEQKPRTRMMRHAAKG